MPMIPGRETTRGKHRLTKSQPRHASRAYATLLAGALLAPAALSLTNAAPATAQAPMLGDFRAPTQGYDERGRAIVHYNNRVHDPSIERAVAHLNA
ncbi:hypothetical protein ACW9HQ_46955, partial [Nocardia gipuzkoensis]